MINQFTTAGLKRITLISTQLLISGFLLLHFNSERSDFRLFYDSTIEFFGQVSPWDVSAHVYGNAYLNDPITLFILYPLTFLSYTNALFLFRALTICSALILNWMIIRHKKENLSIIISLLLLTSITLRANLEYGALGLIIFVFWITAIKFQESNVLSIFAGCLFAYTFMFKPQLYFINLFLVFFATKKVKISFLLTGIFAIIVPSLFLSRFVVNDWANAILTRAKLAELDNAQMDFACLLRLIGINSTTAKIAYVLFMVSSIVFIVKRVGLQSLLKNPILLLLMSTTFSPFLHPTDLSIGMVAMLLAIKDSKRIDAYLLVAISLLAVWSNSWIFALAISLLVVYVSWLKCETKTTLSRSVFALVNSSIPMIFVFLSSKSLYLESFLRNFLNYVGLLLVLLYFVLKAPNISFRDIKTAVTTPK